MLCSDLEKAMYLLLDRYGSLLDRLGREKTNGSTDGEESNTL